MEQEIVLKIPQIDWSDSTTWWYAAGVWAISCWTIFGPMLSRYIIRNSYTTDMLSNKRVLRDDAKENATACWAMSPLILPIGGILILIEKSGIPYLLGRYLYGRNSA